jgi:hypothetical protein
MRLAAHRSFVRLGSQLLLPAIGLGRTRLNLAELDVATIQQREGRWVLADLEGKGPAVALYLTCRQQRFAAHNLWT